MGVDGVGEGVGAPLADAVDVDADPDVLAGDVPAPALAGADRRRHGVVAFRGDRDDAAAQVGARAQRVEEIEIVGRHERAGQGAGESAQSVEGSRGAARHRGQSWQGRCAHIRKRNLRCRRLRNRKLASVRRYWDLGGRDPVPARVGLQASSSQRVFTVTRAGDILQFDVLRRIRRWIRSGPASASYWRWVVPRASLREPRRLFSVEGAR